MRLNFVVMNPPSISNSFADLVFPLESSLFPGINETDDDDYKIGEHDDKSAAADFLKYQRPWKEKHHFYIEKEEDKSNQVEFDRNGIDFFLEIGASAFKRTLFCGIASLGPEEFIHHDENHSQEPKDEEN